MKGAINSNSSLYTPNIKGYLADNRMRSRDPHFKVMHNGEDLSLVTTDASKRVSNRALRGRVSRPELHTTRHWN